MGRRGFPLFLYFFEDRPDMERLADSSKWVFWDEGVFLFLFFLSEEILHRWFWLLFFCYLFIILGLRAHMTIPISCSKARNVYVRTLVSPVFRVHLPPWGLRSLFNE